MFCMEKSSHAIQDFIDEGDWKILQLSARGPTLSYLLSIHDLVLFDEALSSQVEAMLGFI